VPVCQSARRRRLASSRSFIAFVCFGKTQALRSGSVWKNDGAVGQMIAKRPNMFTAPRYDREPRGPRALRSRVRAHIIDLNAREGGARG